MLDCRQTSQLISQSLDRRLTLREQYSLKIHLLICKFCVRFSQHLRIMRVNEKALVCTIEDDNTIEMPSEAKKRITDIVEAHRHQQNI